MDHSLQKMEWFLLCQTTSALRMGIDLCLQLALHIDPIIQLHPACARSNRMPNELDHLQSVHTKGMNMLWEVDAVEDPFRRASARTTLISTSLKSVATSSVNPRAYHSVQLGQFGSTEPCRCTF